RLEERIKNVYHTLPDWVQTWREDWEIRRQGAGKGKDWQFTQPPTDRLQLFRADVTTLVEHIRSAGATPILLTHAHSATYPPRPEDEVYLRRMRMFFPRATSLTMIAFENQANEAVRELGERESILVIDVDAAMSGRREWFADLVHFNDDGAAR